MKWWLGEAQGAVPLSQVMRGGGGAAALHCRATVSPTDTTRSSSCALPGMGSLQESRGVTVSLWPQVFLWGFSLSPWNKDNECVMQCHLGAFIRVARFSTRGTKPCCLGMN